MNVIKPLYGHNSVETSYLVDDYPYGRLRCQIRFWLECNEKKGFRFCSQTQNPKNGRWNTPKMSTYSKLAGAMYLNEVGHCHWTGLSEYSEPTEALEFVKAFPLANLDILKTWVILKIKYLNSLVSKKAFMIVTMNGVPVPQSAAEVDADVIRWQRDLAVWQEVAGELSLGIYEVKKNNG